MLRRVATHQDTPKDGTVEEMIMFGTIMACLFTWDKRGLDWFEKLSGVFWTAWPATRQFGTYF